MCWCKELFGHHMGPPANEYDGPFNNLPNVCYSLVRNLPSQAPPSINELFRAEPSQLGSPCGDIVGCTWRGSLFEASMEFSFWLSFPPPPSSKTTDKKNSFTTFKLLVNLSSKLKKSQLYVDLLTRIRSPVLHGCRAGPEAQNGRKRKLRICKWLSIGAAKTSTVGRIFPMSLSF